MGNILALKFSVNKLTKKKPFGKMNCEIMLLIGAAVKTDVLVN